jgi:CRISPR-associated endonuclease/helicase Cas3
MRPYHAGLLGADALVALDESHLVPPFERLLEQVARNADLGPKEVTDRNVVPRFHLLPLSATGRSRNGGVFRLIEEDREDRVKERTDAKKRLTFEPLGDKKLEEKLAEEAWSLVGDGASPARVLVYCNSREVAGKTLHALRKLSSSHKLPDENFQLFVGARRVYERESARKKLEELRFFSEKDKPPPESPAFVIATAAGEVGVDLDADHMVMDLVPFERMVQRLGRVNRLGGEGREARIVRSCRRPKMGRFRPVQARSPC